MYNAWASTQKAQDTARQRSGAETLPEVYENVIKRQGSVLPGVGEPGPAMDMPAFVRAVLEGNTDVLAHPFQDSIVKIHGNTDRLIGSGSFIDPGWVLTNTHVAAPYSPLMIDDPDENIRDDSLNVTNQARDITLPVSSIYHAPDIDASLLKVPVTSWQKPLPLASNISSLTDPVSLLGMDRHNPNIITEVRGFVASEDPNLLTNLMLAQPGFSGSPIVNTSGQLTGNINARTKLPWSSNKHLAKGASLLRILDHLQSPRSPLLDTGDAIHPRIFEDSSFTRALNLAIHGENTATTDSDILKGLELRPPAEHLIPSQGIWTAWADTVIEKEGQNYARDPNFLWLINNYTKLRPNLPQLSLIHI